jgi:hypothetical protein
MEVLFLFVLLIPVIVLAAIFSICAALFLLPVILLTLPVAIPIWILVGISTLLPEREPAV